MSSLSEVPCYISLDMIGLLSIVSPTFFRLNGSAGYSGNLLHLHKTMQKQVNDNDLSKQKTKQL